MKTHTANGNGGCGAQSRTAIYRAIDWLENYISKNPSTDAAIEARNIIRELESVRLRPGVDELLALLGQIAKSAGLQERQKAKIRMGSLPKQQP
jgi:DNA polymerase/3'-5' exonuclease PolX